MTPDLTAYDVILVASSAGKDSQAMLDMIAAAAAEAGVSDRVVVAHNDLGTTREGRPVEWPGTLELAEQQAARYGLRFEVLRRERGGLAKQIEQRGKWPSNSARYCTSDQKTSQAMKLVTRLVADLQLDRPAQVLYCVGLRAQESCGRARKPELAVDQAHSSGRRTITRWHPILHWTTEQVWDRIHASGVPYHPAYDQGMTRLSCSLCVLSSRPDLIRACQLRPDLARDYAALEDRIGHQFRADLSVHDLMAAAGVSPTERHSS